MDIWSRDLSPKILSSGNCKDLQPRTKWRALSRASAAYLDSAWWVLTREVWNSQ